MDILQLLQTVGICVGSLALVAIAFMLFLFVGSFLRTPSEDIEEPAVIFASILDPQPSQRKARRGKKQKTQDEEYTEKTASET